jgi:hypothetical protein
MVVLFSMMLLFIMNRESDVADLGYVSKGYGCDERLKSKNEKSTRLAVVEYSCIIFHNDSIFLLKLTCREFLKQPVFYTLITTS